MSGGVSTFLKILRSVNNPGSKAKSEKNNQSIPKGSIILESECIYYFSKVDNAILIDLATFSVFILFNSSTL